jgi:hypothetical protein
MKGGAALMSIFDNMMMNNKYPKPTNGKKNSASSLYPEESPRSASGKQTFKEEYAEDLVSDVSRYGIQSYSKAGVTFEKLSETQGKISYSGLLAKCGAQEVCGVYGYGSNQNWENVSTIKLNKEAGDTFQAIIPVEQGKNINIAFKDPAENWDNNSGMNYTFVN